MKEFFGSDLVTETGDEKDLKVKRANSKKRAFLSKRIFQEHDDIMFSSGSPEDDCAFKITLTEVIERHQAIVNSKKRDEISDLSGYMTSSGRYIVKSQNR